MKYILVVLVFSLTTFCHARIGFTKQQCEEKYGPSTKTFYSGAFYKNIINFDCLKYTKNKHTLTIYFYKNKAYEISYNLDVNVDETIYEMLMKKNGAKGLIYSKLIKGQVIKGIGDMSYIYLQCDTNLVASYNTSMYPKNITIEDECVSRRVQNLISYHVAKRKKSSLEDL